jgi:ribosomal protein S18 acetylase RimI-like enzyme
MMKLQTVWKRHDPRERHWHIGPIGVVPELQGRGIGSKLMVKCCERIDSQKDASYLETDRPENLPFYQRFGFKVIAEERILGVMNWFMWRDPSG